MKRILIFLALLLAAYVSFSQSPIYGRLRVISGTYDNYFQNGTDTFKLGWRNDRFQLKYNTNKRFIDLIKSDSTVIIYNKLILTSPNDTMLSVRGASFFSDAITAKYGNNVFKWLNETGSFVAGYDGNNIWNEDSVGEYSVAFGYETKAGSRSPIPELSVYPITVVNIWGNIYFQDNTFELCSALEPYINYNFSVYDSSTSTDYGIVKLTNTCCEFFCKPAAGLIDTETTPVGLIGGETVSFTLINPFPSSSYNYASGYKSTVKGDGSFVHGIENSVNGAGSAILTGYNNSIQSDGSVVLSGEYNNCFGDNNFAFGDTNLVGLKLDSIVYSHDSVVDAAHYIGAPQQFYVPNAEYYLLANYSGQFVEVIDLVTGINYGMFLMTGFGRCKSDTCYFAIVGFTEEFNSLQIQINFNFDTTEYSTIKDFGIVFGDNNTVAGEHSSIIGGKYNYVSGDYSAIISGFRDTLLVDSTVLFKNINIHDTLRFGDFSKQVTAWQPGTSDTGYVKTIGDTMYGKLVLLGNDTMLSVRGVSSLNGVVHINDTVYMSGNFINTEPAYLFTGYVDSSSFVWGKTSTARSRWSFSIGDGSSCEGAFGFAAGNSTNTGVYGFSVNNSGNSGLKGFTSNVGLNNGESGAAVNNSENYGKWSFSANTGIVFAENASGFGLNTFNRSFSSFVVGAYNDTVGSYLYSGTSWIYDEPLFTIGNGTVNHDNTAFLVLKNGKTFIGDSSDVTDAILVVDPTDSTSAFIGNVSITDTVTMEHLTVTDSVTLEDALFDIYNLAPDSDSLLVADDGIINLRTGAYGELRVWVFNSGMYAEYAVVILNADGSIGILVQNSANVTTTGGTDGNLNIYDGGAYTIIENKLGGSRTIKYTFIH